MIGVMLYEEDITVTDTIINNLSSIIAESAQTYIALAIELGILKGLPELELFNNMVIDKQFIKEQKILADSDLEES